MDVRPPLILVLADPAQSRGESDSEERHPLGVALTAQLEQSWPLGTWRPSPSGSPHCPLPTAGFGEQFTFRYPWPVSPGGRSV